MDFRTEITLKSSPHKIGLADPVLTLGSCFAQSIGQKFTDNKFNASVNPFGTTYHPFAIHKLLNYSAWQELPADHTYIDNEGINLNYDFHSSFSNHSKQELQHSINEIIGFTHFYLKSCKILILTYGSAWIYERADTGDPVANCHKNPSSHFTKRLTSAEEVVASFEKVYSVLTSVNPELKIILTVSPVRHIRDTLPLNNVSKSILRIACHQLSQLHTNVEYFPAMEILLDDLRDYRYYKDDLIHPTPAAENYIWEKFASCYFEPATLIFLKEWQEIRKALSHRPFQPFGVAHQKFLSQTLTRLEELKSIVNIDEEINQLKSQIIR